MLPIPRPDWLAVIALGQPPDASGVKNRTSYLNGTDVPASGSAAAIGQPLPFRRPGWIGAEGARISLVLLQIPQKQAGLLSFAGCGGNVAAIGRPGKGLEG